MSNFQVNLSNCDREPIHIPGQIQSHGFLIVLDRYSHVTHYSDNIYDFIPNLTNELLDCSLTDLESYIGISYQPHFLKNLIASSLDRPNFEKTNPVPVEVGGSHYLLIISRSKDLFLLEFEQATSEFDLGIQHVLGKSIAQVLSHKKIDRLLDQTAVEVKDIIEFDRVMVYQFMEDGHGVVVAESKNDDLDPWLGLHYPASDIPKQARELYKSNLTRLIANVHSSPSKISTSGFNPDPLDLSNAQLRAVSPIHIQYLKNMGVVSSFSISILCDGELWGLIACHNYTPRFIDFKSREYAKLIGQILSSALQFRTEEVDQFDKDTLKLTVAKLSKVLNGKQNVFGALSSDLDSFLKVVHCEGVLLSAANNSIRHGHTPDLPFEKILVKWLFDNVDNDVFFHHHLGGLIPEAVGYEGVASGILFCVISREKRECLIWFRPEQIYHVNWAGNPDKPTVNEENPMLQISPRQSFEVWSQAVMGVSEQWKTEEINAVNLLKQEILNAVSLQADAVKEMNDRLREAYEEMESFSYTISHDLKNPIASIKTYAQLLIREKKLEDRSQLMLQRIADRADQMNLMINAVLDYSKVGKVKSKPVVMRMGEVIADIVSDLLIIYHEKKLTVTIDTTHDLYGDEIMLLQVFSNLIGNAVKYSQKSDPALVHVTSIIHGNDVIYSISDNGLGIAEADTDRIFELFNRMENVQDIEGSGVGLAIVKRIVEKHGGKIWVESALNKGSIFYVSLPKPFLH